METNKVLDLGNDSLGQRVAQKVSGVAETAGQKIDAAAAYVDKAKSEVTQSVDKMGVGCEGLKQKVVDYARREPLTALAAAAAAGILLAWITNRRPVTPVSSRSAHLGERVVQN
jgi:ElaB/YqjD/DUF883 family membrane-anchored ribosome-binding protein